MGEAREELGKRHTEWEEPGTVGSVVQLLAPVQLFAVPLTAGRQASLSFIISRSLLKLMSMESVMAQYKMAKTPVNPISSLCITGDKGACVLAVIGLIWTTFWSC